MDIMKINSKCMTSLLSKVISKALSKKLGYKIDIHINGFEATINGDKANVHVNADAEVNSDEFTKIIKNIGLDWATCLALSFFVKITGYIMKERMLYEY